MASLRICFSVVVSGVHEQIVKSDIAVTGPQSRFWSPKVAGDAHST